MRTVSRSLGRFLHRSQTSFPLIARLLAFGFALALSFAPLAAEGRERPQPNRSASDDSLASHPSLWDKMAPFQSVYASCSPGCKSEGGQCTTCESLGYGYYDCGIISCDDFNPCTADACDTQSNKCTHTDIIGRCNDGSACTTNDTCSHGTCVGDPLTGASCDDLNLCTTNDTCSNKGTCVGVPLPDGASCPSYIACVTSECRNLECVRDGPLPDGTSCNDGSACTLNDQCVNGTCYAPVNCDDNNICTSDSCNFSTFSCTHSPISCDDGSPCTADSCDPAIGCVHLGLLQEAGPLVSMDQVTLEWAPAPGSSISNTYRGTIPAGGLRGRGPLYDHVCFESDDAQLNGPQVSVDMENPPEGTSFYYLVDGESLCGEGPLGTGSDGTPEMPTAYCPTPP